MFMQFVWGSAVGHTYSHPRGKDSEISESAIISDESESESDTDALMQDSEESRIHLPAQPLQYDIPGDVLLDEEEDNDTTWRLSDQDDAQAQPDSDDHSSQSSLKSGDEDLRDILI
jgi:hypothetical protein